MKVKAQAGFDRWDPHPSPPSQTLTPGPYPDFGPLLPSPRLQALGAPPPPYPHPTPTYHQVGSPAPPPPPISALTPAAALPAPPRPPLAPPRPRPRQAPPPPRPRPRPGPFSPSVLSSSVQLKVRMRGVRYCRLTTVT